MKTMHGFIAIGLLVSGLAATPLFVATAEEPAAAHLEAGRDFGEAIRSGKLVALDELVRDPERFAGRDVLIRGRISDVCQKKGCWTILSSEESHVRVDFKDYGFFVPTSSSGKLAYVEGRVKIARVSEGDARHYAGESTSPDGARWHRAGRQVGFTARGVRIVGSD